MALLGDKKTKSVNARTAVETLYWARFTRTSKRYDTRPLYSSSFVEAQLTCTWHANMHS